MKYYKPTKKERMLYILFTILVFLMIGIAGRIQQQEKNDVKENISVGQKIIETRNILLDSMK